MTADAIARTALVLGRRRRGRKIGPVIQQTRRRLEAAGWHVTAKLVDRKRELRRHARRAVRDKVDVVVAVGGDGAVLQVVQVLAESRVALAIIPMGTGNLLASNLGIPTAPEDAASVVVDGTPRRIDVGRATIGGKRRMFAVACGVGFDAEVMQATPKVRKARWGKLAYVAAAVQERDQVRNVAHEIELDGETTTTEATQVFVANFGRTGLGLEPRLKVEPDDGILDVIVVRADGAIAGLLAGWEAIRQRRRGESSQGHVFRAHARKIRISATPDRLVETDGSVVGTTPITISVRPQALSVIAPGMHEASRGGRRRAAS